MKNAQRLTALIAITLIALVVGRATATQGVSPGALDRLAQVSNPCPTFSWQGASEAAQYEIVAYSLHTDEDPAEVLLAAEAEVLYTQVPSGATSWTPSSDQCFAAGGRYVWFVRAVIEMVNDQVIETGEWSSGRYFSVPAGPSAEDVARAVEVLKQWEATNGGGSLMLSSAAAAVSVPAPVAAAGAATGSGTGSSHRKSVPTAAAAVRGEHPGTTGEVYGVVGTSASMDGAGVAAANLAGGPDLVLDGSAQGVPDTTISEAGIDRVSAGQSTFTLQNSGAGRIDLDVIGDVYANTIDIEEFKINGSTVVDDTGEWMGLGSTVPCTNCVGSTDITDGSVATADLAADSVTGAKILDGTVTYRELAVDAVRGSHIRNGDVTAADLAAGSVGTNELVNGAVTMAKLAPESVGTHHIEYGGVEMDNIASNAVGTDQIVSGGVESIDVLDGALTAADMDPAGGVYSSKSAVYEVVVSENVSPGGLCFSAIADCSDSNDLPLTFYCVATPQVSGLTFSSAHTDYWSTTSNPASSSCTYCNFTASTQSFEAHILCVSVPGS